MPVCPSHSRPSSRRPIALFGAVLLGACEIEDGDTNAAAPPNVVEAVTERPRVLPLPSPGLDRVALLGAVAQAASAFAAGADDRPAQARLEGRRFVMKLRFGCGGPATADSDDALRWRVRSDTSLEIRATPDLSLDDPALAGTLTDTVEAVEGFWIPRPWLFSERCPAPGPRTAILGVPPERSVGIAQYYTEDESRVERRSGRDYVSTVSMEPETADENTATGGVDEAVPREGLFLSIEGRLRSWPDGKVIRCVASATGGRPSCIVSIKMDRVAFIDPRDGSEIDEWSR